jgi:hypothetical protein
MKMLIVMMHGELLLLGGRSLNVKRKALPPTDGVLSTVLTLLYLVLTACLQSARLPHKQRSVAD